MTSPSKWTLYRVTTIWKSEAGAHCGTREAYAIAAYTYAAMRQERDHILDHFGPVEGIPSPYRYSPTVCIHAWKGKKVVWFETSHRRYEVFEVHPGMRTFTTDDEATDWHLTHFKVAS